MSTHGKGQKRASFLRLQKRRLVKWLVPPTHPMTLLARPSARRPYFRAFSSVSAQFMNRIITSLVSLISPVLCKADNSLLSTQKGIIVLIYLCNFPSRFGGRVETAPESGLCLYMESPAVVGATPPYSPAAATTSPSSGVKTSLNLKNLAIIQSWYSSHESGLR